MVSAGGKLRQDLWEQLDFIFYACFMDDITGLTQIACTVYPVQRVSQEEESGQVTVELQSSLRSAVDTFTLNTPYQV